MKVEITRMWVDDEGNVMAEAKLPDGWVGEVPGDAYLSVGPVGAEMDIVVDERLMETNEFYHFGGGNITRARDWNKS